MKQIKLILTRSPYNNDWKGEVKWDRYPIGLCGETIRAIQPLAAEKWTLRMMLSSKELPGFVPVNLHRSTPYDFWRWEIPTLGLVELPGHRRSDHIFSFNDSIVTGVILYLMGKGTSYKVPLKYTVWLKLTTIN